MMLSLLNYIAKLCTDPPWLLSRSWHLTFIHLPPDFQGNTPKALKISPLLEDIRISYFQWEHKCRCMNKTVAIDTFYIKSKIKWMFSDMNDKAEQVTGRILPIKRQTWMPSEYTIKICKAKMGTVFLNDAKSWYECRKDFFLQKLLQSSNSTHIINQHIQSWTTEF